MTCKIFIAEACFLLLFALNGYSKTDPAKKITRQEYINRYSKIAIREMKEYSIPASITLAQACLESADGNSLLTRTSNNHFGIKCKSNWTGEKVYHDDDEKGECFRKYSSPLESFRDHSKFLNESARYKFLFNYKITDYRQWAYGLKKAGYATNPAYPESLIKIIEDYALFKYDKYYKSGRGLSVFGSGSKSSEAREVERRNGRKAFFAREGDTFEDIAIEFSMEEERILSYNDCSKERNPEANSVVYLQKKRGKAPRGNDFHTARENESLWSISQWYGVRLNALYRFNHMKKGEEPRPGQKISLRKRIRQ